MTGKTSNEADWFVIDVLLDQVAAATRVMRRRNPAGRSGTGCHQVVLARQRFTNLDDLQRGATRRVSTHATGIGIQYRRHSEIGALKKRDEFIASLRKRGEWVLNGFPAKNRRVYVVLLRADAAEVPGAARRNPNRDLAMACVYVGETALTESERLDRHLAGRRASRWVQKFGIRLAPQLNPRDGLPMDRLAALRWERDLAKDLRRQRFTVFGGH